MRRTILALLLAATSGAAAADFGKWEMVDRTDAFVIYADTATIRRLGEQVQMWELSDARTDKALAMVRNARSFKMEREYDCARQQLRLLYVSWHSENMGEGAIVGSNSVPGPWQPVLAGTIGERLWKIACGLNQGRRF